MPLNLTVILDADNIDEVALVREVELQNPSASHQNGIHSAKYQSEREVKRDYTLPCSKGRRANDSRKRIDRR